LEVIGKREVSRGRHSLDQRRLKALCSRYPSHDAALWVVVHIVILVDGVAEDPEVVDAGQEVDHAESVVARLTQVRQQVLPADLDPVLFHHEPQVAHLVTAVSVVDTVFLIVVHTEEQSLEELLAH